MARGGWRRCRTACALGVGLLVGLIAASCSGDEDPAGSGDTPASPAATSTQLPPRTALATSEPATEPATATWTSTATPPAATVTPAGQPSPVPAATPTATPAAIQPQKHANGTFTIVVSHGAVRVAVHVEVAATLAQRQQGLMFRAALGENEGMLFLFDRDVQTGFWMRNTRVPLDIAYIGADLRVKEIKQGTPFDETPLVPAERYRYVLEVNQGWFERNGLGPGAVIELPDGLPAPTAD